MQANRQTEDIDEPPITAKQWIPNNVAEKFIYLYKSLEMSVNSYNESNESVRPIFNPNLSKNQVIAIYHSQMGAIKSVLTSGEFEEFWKKCTNEQAR